MKNIIKTLALLTAGVGAVAVVRRVRNQQSEYKRKAFEDEITQLSEKDYDKQVQKLSSFLSQ